MIRCSLPSTGGSGCKTTATAATTNARLISELFNRVVVTIAVTQQPLQKQAAVGTVVKGVVSRGWIS